MNIDLKNNNLIISLSDIFDAMTDEQLAEAGRIYGWKSEWYKGILAGLRHELGAPHFNEDFYQLRKEFFLNPVDFGYEVQEDTEIEEDERKYDIIYVMSRTVRELIEEIIKLKADVYKHEKAWNSIQNFLHSYGLNDDSLYTLRSIHSNLVYSTGFLDEIDEATYNVEKTHIKKLVAKWTDEVVNRLENQNEY